jgi:RNA polymerase sigma-70 factor (ECF subfamily)
MTEPSLGTSVPVCAPRRQEFATSLSLLVRLRVHDQEAWQQFLALYAPLVVRWCHRRGLAEQDIADVAQEVFTRVAVNIQQFRKETPADSLRGWLCRITHRQIADFFRRRDSAASAQGGSEALRRLQEQVDPLPGESAEDVREETHFLFQKAMTIARGEFTDETWQMFWRVAVDGNSATAIAAEMGTTPAAVRQAKSRVLRRLKQVVGDVPE